MAGAGAAGLRAILHKPWFWPTVGIVATAGVAVAATRRSAGGAGGSGATMPAAGQLPATSGGSGGGDALGVLAQYQANQLAAFGSLAAQLQAAQKANSDILARLGQVSDALTHVHDGGNPGAGDHSQHWGSTPGDGSWNTVTGGPAQSPNYQPAQLTKIIETAQNIYSASGGKGPVPASSLATTIRAYGTHPGQLSPELQKLADMGLSQPVGTVIHFGPGGVSTPQPVQTVQKPASPPPLVIAPWVGTNNGGYDPVPTAPATNPNGVPLPLRGAH